ncbi:MAG: site-specific integrase [Chthoniobacter sp.]|uniref:site-specific integrase n=1 Tax=Chthoniobacter sp. TaxID=2510640 RepID=UPI0032ABFE8F
MNETPQKSQELKKVAECLYRNGNKVYFALVKVRGKQIKRSLKTDDMAIAKRRLAELREKAERLHGKENKNIRFEELAENWMESIKASLKPKSHDRRRVAIVGLTPFFKGMPVKAVGFAEIDEWRRKRGASISARSHNIELETLKNLLRYACDRGILMDNRAEDFKRRKQPKAVVDVLTRPQFQVLVKALYASPIAVASGAAAMVEFLAYSGMRVGEAREVRFCDVNFETNTILITSGESGTKNHEERTIPLFPNLRNLIQRIKAARPTADANDRIFQIDSPRGALPAACKRAGLPHFSVHSLRHFFASNAIENDVNFKVVAGWLGHSDGGMLVAKTYGHLRQEFSATMAQKMTFEGLSDTPPTFAVVRDAAA